MKGRKELGESGTESPQVDGSGVILAHTKQKLWSAIRSERKTIGSTSAQHGVGGSWTYPLPTSKYMFSSDSGHTSREPGVGEYATPKSMSATLPDVSRSMFRGLISRCAIRLSAECKYATPERT